MSRLVHQIREIVAKFEQQGIAFALIGGLALAAHQVPRATQDVDLLVDADDSDRVDQLMSLLGYKCVHRSVDAGNYLRGDEGTDFIYASRPIARRLLGEAVIRNIPQCTLRVVGIEGLIGLKLQGLVNNPRRTQDVEDIRALLRVHKSTLNMTEVRDYFNLFDRSTLLDELIAET